MLPTHRDRLLIEHFAERLFHLGETVDWDKILTFLPSFERPGFFPKGCLYLPEVYDFHQRLYESGALFPFDWDFWFPEFRRLFEDPDAVAAADEATLRKILFVHVRTERHNGVHLHEIVETGHVTAILRRLKELQEEGT